jgi:hypothetical protein
MDVQDFEAFLAAHMRHINERHGIVNENFKRYARRPAFERAARQQSRQGAFQPPQIERVIGHNRIQPAA